MHKHTVKQPLQIQQMSRSVYSVPQHKHETSSTAHRHQTYTVQHTDTKHTQHSTQAPNIHSAARRHQTHTAQHTGTKHAQCSTPSWTSMSSAGCSQSLATGELCLLALPGLPTNGLLSLDPSSCLRPADSSASKLAGAAAKWAAAKCSTAEASGCSLQASTAAARPKISSKVNCRHRHVGIDMWA